MVTLEPVWECVVARGYKVTKMLGVGTFGVVVKARDTARSTSVAIKHIKVDQSKYSLLKVLRELEITRFLSDPSPSQPEMKHFFAGLLDIISPPVEI